MVKKNSLLSVSAQDSMLFNFRSVIQNICKSNVIPGFYFILAAATSSSSTSSPSFSIEKPFHFRFLSHSFSNPVCRISFFFDFIAFPGIVICIAFRGKKNDCISFSYLLRSISFFI